MRNPQLRFGFENRRPGSLKRRLRDQIVNDRFRDQLPVDRHQIDTHIWHFGKRHVYWAIYKGNSLQPKKLGHRVRSAKTKHGSQL